MESKKDKAKTIKVKKLKKRLRIKKTKKEINTDVKTCSELKEHFKREETVLDKTDAIYQNLLRCIEKENRKEVLDDKKDYLYPIFQDEEFNYKIANKKEFNDYKYDEKSDVYYENIKQLSDKECISREFELSPHQMFVRNYLSFQTPYNGLLLYHEVGTGKTCSAISVCEEMRSYMLQINSFKKIIIVASPAVQENFKIQLFDERKLKNIDGVWNINSCTGNKFLKEINPTNMVGMERRKVIKKIRSIINRYYYFMGYVQFSNYLQKIMDKTVSKGDKKAAIKRKQIKALKKEFSQRMVVIDEVHNLRIIDKKTEKDSTENLMKLVTNTQDLKLLLLSATPMFNSYLEIIWIINVLNLNDGRFMINKDEIFDSNGNFITSDDGKEIGKELFIQKTRGYISYVKGNDPLTFPFIIYPKQYDNPNSYLKQIEDGLWRYPMRQMNGAHIIEPIKSLDLFLTPIGEYQKIGYDLIFDQLKIDKNLTNETQGMNYTFLEPLLQSLNIIYPHISLDDGDRKEVEENYKYLYGGRGLSRVMLYDKKTKRNFSYKDETIEKYGRLFAPENIGKYSAKIKSICDSIMVSRGIVFIFSQYIEGGAVPVALALEEMGITRYGKNGSLFEKPPTERIDAITMTAEPMEGQTFKAAKYAMILGEKSLTPDIKGEIQAITSSKNINGEIVKVLIVSKAGSEGLDFKNIRETHILDPWYNLNRQDQIIGRSVRNLSHCSLPFEKRNVNIFLYGTKLDSDIEAADLYLYRLSENKAKKISNISRILKENAVDCLLNKKGKDYSQDKLNAEVEQIISTGQSITLKIGEKNGSMSCDFKECNYKCMSSVEDISPDTIDKTTYNYDFIQLNIVNIVNKIKNLFKENYIYDKINIIKGVQQTRAYPEDQINSALDLLTNNTSEYITDMLGRLGRLINIDNYYFFQPLEIDTRISRYEQVHPINFKREGLFYKLPEKGDNKIILEKITEDRTKSSYNYLLTCYGELTNKSDIQQEDKENWIKIAAWTIYNMTTWGGFDRNLLIKFAMFHIIDSLSFQDKYYLLKYHYSVEGDEGKKGLKSDSEEFVDNTIQDYLDKFILIGGKNQGIVIANFNKQEKKLPYTILTKIDNEWKNDNNAIVSYQARILLDKFNITDTSLINDFIGFMVMFKNQVILFKSKSLKLSDKGRKNIGERCDRGQTKNSIIKLINNILQYDKYKLNKSTVTCITNYKKEKEHNDKGNFQKIDDDDQTSRYFKINTFQLCIELELTLRYFDFEKKNGKRWFFNTVDTIINQIEDMVK